MIAASTSRLSAIGSLLFIVHLTIKYSPILAEVDVSRLRFWRAKFAVSSRRLLHVLRLGRHGPGPIAFQCGHQGVPGQNGAFDASREFVDACKDGEFPHIAQNASGSYHLMYLLENLLNITSVLAFDAVGQQRS